MRRPRRVQLRGVEGHGVRAGADHSARPPLKVSLRRHHGLQEIEDRRIAKQALCRHHSREIQRGVLSQGRQRRYRRADMGSIGASCGRDAYPPADLRAKPPNLRVAVRFGQKRYRFPNRLIRSQSRLRLPRLLPPLDCRSTPLPSDPQVLDSASRSISDIGVSRPLHTRSRVSS
jgi:hypothetical protein